MKGAHPALSPGQARQPPAIPPGPVHPGSAPGARNGLRLPGEEGDSLRTPR